MSSTLRRQVSSDSAAAESFHFKTRLGDRTPAEPTREQKCERFLLSASQSFYKKKVQNNHPVQIFGKETSLKTRDVFSRVDSSGSVEQKF